MNLARALAAVLLVLLPLSGSAGAEALLPVPAGLTSGIAAPLQQERTVLAKEQRTLKSRIDRHKSKCQRENPGMAQVCHNERQSLLSAGDQLDRKVMEFNRKIQGLTKPKPVEVEATE